MSTKQAYEQKINAQLAEWKAEINKLRAKLTKVDADAKIESEKEISQLEARYEAAKAKLRELTSASDQAWESMRKGLDSSFDSMKSAFKDAQAKFQN
jgi:septal ring factor EnvC (AmiA/AmiB activator)